MQSYAEPMWRRLLRELNVAADHTKCEHNVWPYVTHAVAEWGKGALGAKPTNRSRLGHADLQRGKAALMAIQRARTHAKAGQAKCVAVLCRLAFAGIAGACWPLRVANSQSSCVDERFHSY